MATPIRKHMEYILNHYCVANKLLNIKIFIFPYMQVLFKNKDYRDQYLLRFL